MHNTIPRRLKIPRHVTGFCITRGRPDYMSQHLDIDIQHEKRRPTCVLYEYAIR